MRRFLLLLVLGAVSVAAQDDVTEAEDAHLRQLLAEAGSSPIEFIRALEIHLGRFPNSAHKKELERSLVKAAIEANDERRILLYGERALEGEGDDLQVLERVTHALLATNDRDRAGRAWKYAERLEASLKELEQDQPRGRRSQAEWREELDRGLARALLCKARAAASLGRLEDAVALAGRSYETYPAAESAREIGLLLDKAGKTKEALPHLADAFAIADPRNSDRDRARDRVRLGELYRKNHGSEADLGDLILQAYDRTTALLEARRLRQRESDPNAGIENPMEFTLSGLRGEKLLLGSLRGSVLVLDFWATWCAPCRVQHPIYEKVKKRYEQRKDVLFLSINTDEDLSVVEPFLKQAGWQKTVYFEDGLSRALRVSSIPTTLIVNKHGEISGRLTGFVPDRFEDMLVERIEEALRR